MPKSPESQNWGTRRVQGEARRSVRFPKAFVDKLAPMFPKRSSRKGVTAGAVCWKNPDGHAHQVFGAPWMLVPALEDDLRTLLVQGSLEIEGLETTGLASA